MRPAQVLTVGGVAYLALGLIWAWWLSELEPVQAYVYELPAEPLPQELWESEQAAGSILWHTAIDACQGRQATNSNCPAVLALAARAEGDTTQPEEIAHAAR